MPPDTDAASYARTSTEQQKSCSEQQEQCRKLIDNRGWRQRYRLQDEGHKGASPDRPAYKHLLELVEEQRVHVVVTWKLDRMFRSLKEASNAQELFQARKVALVSVTEPFDTTTSIGKFVFGFLVNVAAFETDLIKERALLGYERRTREGKWTGPNKPFGYRCDGLGRLEIDPLESPVVALMHERYARLAGDARLAAWLNREGHTCRGKPWTAERVRRVLTNPVCIGDLTIRGTKAHHSHLAIISKKRFKLTAHHRGTLQHLGKHHASAEREAGLDRVMSEYLGGLEADEAQ
jgi:site-specific DNA recombinase